MTRPERPVAPPEGATSDHASTRPVRVTFVRHGESEANLAGRWQGHPDSPLSTRGLTQASRAGMRLGAVPFDFVISSDLTRAYQTAKASGHGVETDPSFREIDVGGWEGLTRAEVLERFPDEIAALMRGEDVRIGGGESWADATTRARGALERLRARMAPGQHAAVFSHGGVITSLFLGFVGVERRRPQPLGHMVNTAISTVRFERGVAIVERYNDATHVAPDGPWARKMFGQDDALVALLAWDEDSGAPDASLEPLAHALHDVTRVYASRGGAVAETARRVAARLGVAFDGERAANATSEELAALHAGERVLLVTPRSMVHLTAHEVVARLGQTTQFGEPDLGSLTHVARTKSVVLIADYNADPRHERI